MSRFFNAVLAVVLLPALSGLAACGDDAPGDKRPASGGVVSDSAAAAEEFAKAEPITASNTPLTFALRPKPGDRFSYRLEQSSSTNLGGKKIDDVTVYHFTLTITGTNDDGSVTAEMRYDSIRVRRAFAAGVVDSVARTIAFDTRTDSKKGVAGAEQYTALIGRRITMTLDKDGQVEEVSNLDPIINAMVGDKRDQLQPKDRETLRQLIKLQAVAVVVQQLFLQSVPEDSTVTPGREWTRTDTSRQMGIRARSLIRYKLADVRQVEDRPVGRVQVSLKTDFLERQVDNELVSAKIDDVAVSGGGEALIMMDNGFPSSKKTGIEMRMKLTGEVKVGPEKGKTETLEQSVVTRTNVQLVGFVPGGTD